MLFYYQSKKININSYVLDCKVYLIILCPFIYFLIKYSWLYLFWGKLEQISKLYVNILQTLFVKYHYLNNTMVLTFCPLKSKCKKNLKKGL